MDGGAWRTAVHGITRSRTRLSDFTLFFHFHALEKEMATHSSVLDWRIPGTGEPGGLLSMGSHRVRHDWSDLAAVAAAGQQQSPLSGTLIQQKSTTLLTQTLLLHLRLFLQELDWSSIFTIWQDFFFLFAGGKGSPEKINYFQGLWDPNDIYYM